MCFARNMCVIEPAVVCQPAFNEICSQCFLLLFYFSRHRKAYCKLKINYRDYKVSTFPMHDIVFSISIVVEVYTV